MKNQHIFAVFILLWLAICFGNVSISQAFTEACEGVNMNAGAHGPKKTLSLPAVPTGLNATAIGPTQIDLNWQADLKIVVLGSSTAEGRIGPSPGQGWVNLLSNWITANTEYGSVINLALGGYNTNDVIPSGNPDRNITKALSYNPQLILVNLPTNDVYEGVPLQTTMDNYRTLRSLAQAAGVTIFFTTSQPRTNGTSAQRALLQVTADSIRAAFGEYVIDIYDELTDFNNDLKIKPMYKYSGDNIHLNDAGHLYIFNTTLPIITPYLPRFEAHRSSSAAGPFALQAITYKNSFSDTGLTPGTTYYYKVRTVNDEGTSAFTSVVWATTPGERIYYLKAGTIALNDPAAWGDSPDGTGVSPPDFVTANQHFVIRNRTHVNLGSSWIIEGSNTKVIVGAGITFTINSTLNARIDVQENSVLNINHASSPPTLVALSTTSTVRYAAAANVISRAAYGNLVLEGAGDKIFSAGLTTIARNLQIVGQIALNGAAGNQTELVVSGNITFSNAASPTPDDTRIGLTLNTTGTQRIEFDGTLDLHHLRTTDAGIIQIENNGGTAILSVGSSGGGGLSLTNGSILKIDSNTLVLAGAGTVNTHGETGAISVYNGDITVASSSSTNTHLYFDSQFHRIKRFTLNLAGTAHAVIHSPADVTEGLKITDGILDANSFITLLSTSSGHAANLEAIENDGSIQGDITIERYMDVKADVYRYLSPPVEDVTIAAWQQFFPITGTFGGASTGPGLSKEPSLYYYDEPAGWVAYPTTSNLATLQKGRGYAVYIRNDTDTVIRYVGRPYQGNVPFTIDGSTESTPGWNLLGNPYASTIQWSNDMSAWIKSGINPVIAVRNNVSATVGQFHYYDATTGLSLGNEALLDGGRLAPGQAFWVQAITAEPAITVTEKAKITDGQIIFRRKTNTVSRIEVSVTQGKMRDPALIIFADYATDGFDKKFDRLKQNNVGMFNLSTVANGDHMLAINSMDNIFCNNTIDLNLQHVKPGHYNLFVALDHFTYTGSVTLMDAFTGTTWDLRDAPLYFFSVTDDENSYGPNRFKIRLPGSPPAIMQHGDTLYSNMTGNLQWFRDGHLYTSGMENFIVPKQSGVYTVSITDGTCTKTSEPFEMIVTSGAPVASYEDALTLSVYPNPTQKNNIRFKIKSKSIAPVTIRIITATGLEVYKGASFLNQSLEREIHLEGTVSAGIYFILAEQNGNTDHARLYVE